MQAKYCGVDIGKKKNYAYFLDSEHHQVGGFEFKHSLTDYHKVYSYLGKDSHVVLEPTGVYSVNLFTYLKNKGVPIRFSNTNSSNHTIRSTTSGVKKKTDSADARGLALHSVINWESCYTSLPMLDNIRGYDNILFYIRLKELVEQYEMLSLEVSKVKNKIDGLITLRYPELAYLFKKPNSMLAMKFMCLESQDYSFPAREIARFMGTTERYLPEVTNMKEGLKESVGYENGMFNNKVTETRQLVREVMILSKEKKKIALSMDDLIKSTCFSTLYEIKGIDTYRIAVLLTEIRDISRFNTGNKKKSLKCFRKYCGFNITSNSSGQKEGTHKLSRSGNLKLRNLFYMLAMTMISSDEYFKQFYEEKCKTMVKKKAILRTAYHLCANIYFRLLKYEWKSLNISLGEF